MSSSDTKCAACRHLGLKCMQGCIYAPHFPPDMPQKFANVHHVFGARNVARLLSRVQPSEREELVNALCYAAEARIRDPVSGPPGMIEVLQETLRQIQLDTGKVKKELSMYIGPRALSSLQDIPINTLFEENTSNREESSAGFKLKQLESPRGHSPGRRSKSI